MRLLLSTTALILACLFMASCGSNNSVQGYAEGRFSYISANYAGILDQLQVTRGNQVTLNQPLFILDPQPESDQLNQAKSQVVLAQAQITQNQATVALAVLTWQRQSELLSKHVASQDAVDQARTQLDQAKAQLAQANANLVVTQAALVQAQWVIQQKTVVATKAGFVYDTYFLPGELVPAGQPILSILAPQDISVIFYVPETQLGALHLGQVVQINCDSCKDTIKSKISYISTQAEYAPPILYSDEMRSKLIFRIEATPVSMADATKLHPGQPVDIEL